jgi:hypothetical protein
MFLLAWMVSAKEQLDLSSPEATLAGYIESLRQGDVEGVLARYHGTKDFYLPGPLTIEDYEIVTKITFGKKEVQEWNGQKIIPAAKVGDVQLDVKQLRGDDSQMYSYFLREITGKWKLIAHYGWDAP